MEIVWEVDDGYSSRAAPHCTWVDDDELNEFETDEEREQLISEVVQEDFELSVSWYITNKNPDR